MFCVKCGKPLEDGAAFCTNCGASASESMDAQVNEQVNATEVPPVQPEPVVEQSVPKMESQTQQAYQPQQNYQSQPVYQQPVNNNSNNGQAGPVYSNIVGGATYIPEEYRPITAWGYVGWQLLFSIPIAGLIVLIVFACGGTKRVPLKSFARSYFCWMLLSFIITFVIVLFCMVFAASLGNM